MASCKEKSVSAESRCISHSFTGDDEPVQGKKFPIQEQSRAGKPKLNRLKRANRTKQSDVMLSEYKVIIISDGEDDKCSHASIRSQNTHDVRCSPPKRGLVLPMNRSQTTQRKHEVKSESAAASLQCLSDGAGSLRRSGPCAERSDLCQYEQSESEDMTVFHSHAKSSTMSASLRVKQSSTAIFKDTHAREEYLQQVCSQNPRFPVRRLFQTLLKRNSESKNTPVSTVAGKRKQEVESHIDGRHHKRHCSNQDDSETVKTSESGGRFAYGVTRRNRLRRKQPCQQNPGVKESQQEERNQRHRDDDVGHDDDDVPWTEKYRPRSSDEVVGNSSAMMKLYSWLKQWKIRADVEEKRKRREERRMKEECDGSWDCGDFEGDPLMEECEGELCNTLLIHGPTGAGKSAAVYACAEQLGFNVLEVNSSSLRSGRLVLSQLRESTQSHQVGAPQRSVSHTHTPAAASREEAPQKSISFCSKSSVASRKKPAAAQKTLNLTRYFRKTGKLVTKHSKYPRDTGAADVITLHESEIKKDDVGNKKDKTLLISLILFEEVDIVFEEDVGFLKAVKSLMSTTKRPIILTSNDPLFSESFDACFEEIRFKIPAMESVVSYLQCVCAVHNVKPDPEHICYMLQENNRDVRRSVLELEFWVRSGAGNTHHHLRNRALTCRSYAELQSSRCVEVLVESWRKGRCLLYSNLDLLLAPLTLGQNKIYTFPNAANKALSSSCSRKCFGQRTNQDILRTNRWNSSTALPLVRIKQTNPSAAGAGGSSEVDTLAHYFDTMSFIDSYLSLKSCCKSGPLGATMTDSLLDLPREEEGSELSAHTLERCYEILAVVEGLGFHSCRMEVWPMGRREDQEGDKDKSLSEQRSSDIIHKVLSSDAFRYHGNQTAVVTDYLPHLRFICRQQSGKQRPERRFSHYLRDIGLHLPKSILQHLSYAKPFPLF